MSIVDLYLAHKRKASNALNMLTMMTGCCDRLSDNRCVCLTASVEPVSVWLVSRLLA